MRAGLPALERTLAAFEEKFGEFLPGMEWVNFGGGHHITRPDYDVDDLVRLLRDFRARHGVEVYLEPGEAIALDTGVLVAEVLDLPWNGMPTRDPRHVGHRHMPDVLEMPYRAADHRRRRARRERRTPTGSAA